MTERDIVESVSNPFEPPRPTLIATGVFSIWVAILALPMLSGQFLAGRFSDQYDAGFAFREWLATQWKATGRIPLWNPDLFGGLPFVGAMHGDIFYPTSWMRLVLPTDVAMNLGFVIHYILAALFLYLLLRRLKVSWVGAVVGGLAYQLSGVIGSYVQPGHDGKLFVTALLPLALLGLVMGIREKKVVGYGIVALAVGLALVSPHAQMTYYMLIVAGIFALYLAFGERDERPLSERLTALALALAAVLVGFGVGMIQILPFFEYIPFSPRAEGYRGFEGSASYAIPWLHVPEFFLARFTGETNNGTYWATNPLKLHSEYLGLPVIALAVLGFRSTQRRLVYWLSGIGVLFLLVALGAATPFYRVWYEVMPFVKQTRAPGMALYVVALVLATLAALGVQRLERGAGEKLGVPLMVTGGVIALLGLVGGFGAIAESFARGIELERGMPVARMAAAGAETIRFGAFGSGLALALLGAVLWARTRQRLTGPLFAAALVLIVSGDLWRNARAFWTYTESPRTGLYRTDPVTRYLAGVPRPYRVLNFPRSLQPPLDVYPSSSLMAFDVPQLLGYHGNELRAFDELAGGKNRWSNVFNPRLWDLFALKFVIVPAAVPGLDTLPGYELRLDDVETSSGVRAKLFEREDVRYARFVPGAVKVEDERAIATLMQTNLSFDQLVLLPPDAPVEPVALDSLPDEVDIGVSVSDWRPGAMTIRLSEPAPADGYILVAENYYPDWHATVDGEAVQVLRGNVSLITVPVTRGAQRVALLFQSRSYEIGRLVTLMSLLIVVASFAVPVVMRRLRG